MPFLLEMLPGRCSSVLSRKSRVCSGGSGAAFFYKVTDGIRGYQARQQILRGLRACRCWSATCVGGLRRHARTRTHTLPHSGNLRLEKHLVNTLNTEAGTAVTFIKRGRRGHRRLSKIDYMRERYRCVMWVFNPLGLVRWAHSEKLFNRG